MEKSMLRVGLSVLWLIQEVSTLRDAIILGVFASPYLDELGIVLLVALIMAVLSLALNEKANQWANMVMGVVYAFIAIYTLSTQYQRLPQPELAILPASGAVFALLIVWFAYKSSRS